MVFPKDKEIPALPEGYSIRKYQGEEDIPHWIRICNNGLVGYGADNSAFTDCMEGIDVFKDCFFICNEENLKLRLARHTAAIEAAEKAYGRPLNKDEQQQIVSETQNKIKSFVTGVANTVKTAFTAKKAQATAMAHAVLDGTVAEAYVDTGVKVLIAVVIGALILTLLYALFNEVMAPAVEQRVEAMFNYAG